MESLSIKVMIVLPLGLLGNLCNFLQIFSMYLHAHLSFIIVICTENAKGKEACTCLQEVKQCNQNVNKTTRAMSATSLNKTFLVMSLPQQQQFWYSFMNLSIFAGAVGSSAIYQETQEQSHLPTHLVIGIQTLVPALNSDVAYELFLVPLSHGLGVPGKHCLIQSTYERAFGPSPEKNFHWSKKCTCLNILKRSTHS